MDDGILSLLQMKAPAFSKGQRRIAQYITEEYEKAAFLTASQLGKMAGVSESTVVRFAVELGYDGYPDMQKAMQTMVMNRLTSVQRMGVAAERLADHDVLSSVLQSDADRLRRTADTICREDFASAVAAILKARRICILGVRSASALADFLGYYLNLMFDSVQVITVPDYASIVEKLIGISSEDAVIAFSFPRYSASVVKAARFCQGTGAAVISVTDSRLSPLGQCSEYVLTAKSGMVSLVDSLTAPMSVVNALIAALASRREQTLSKTFNTLEQVWEEYNVYEKQVEKP